MSSGFVSGGTAEQPIKRDDEWLKAQQEIEANRRRKEEADRQEGGKTLYEVLQNNKGELPRSQDFDPQRSLSSSEANMSVIVSLL